MDNKTFKEGLDLISSILEVFIPAKEDNGRTFINEINKLDKSYCKNLIQHYRNIKDSDKKVNGVRIKTLEMALERKITYEEILKIFEDDKKRYKYSNRSLFSVLYPLYYYQFKNDVKSFFLNIIDDIVKEIGDDKIEGDFNDFEGATMYGKDFVLFGFCSKAWTNENNKRKRAKQFRITTVGKEYAEVGIFSSQRYQNSKKYKISDLSRDLIIKELKENLDEILADKPSDEEVYDIYKEFEEFYNINLGPYQETDTYQSQIDAREAFLTDYPFDNFMNISLEDYVIGSGSKDTFCYGFEFGKYRLLGPGIGGGSAGKYGIYYSKDKGGYADRNGILLDKPYEVWERMKKEIVKLVNDIKDSSSVEDFDDNIEDFKSMQLPLLKLLNAYCPHKIIGAASWKALKGIADVFNISSDNLSSIKLNYQITKNIIEHLPFLKESEPEGLSHMIWIFWLQKTSQEEGDRDDEVVDTNLKDPNTYSKYEFLDEVFMTENQYDTIADTLKRKKNIILMGAPGVGKTFCAKKLMYSIMGERAKDRIVTVQFHQSYSYEDFIQGYRPNCEGNFELKDGVFYNLVEEARKNYEESLENGEEPKKYCIIIDEINRGNLSKVFGELMMLIEADKRRKERSVKLTYSDKDFYIPENLYIIGTMNTADRSLTMVDYALRRRFAFIQLDPAFSNPEAASKLKNWLVNRDKIDIDFVDKLIEKYAILNRSIESNLGKGFCIGHSYFIGQNLSDNPTVIYQDILQFEIKPLLNEYYFDDKNNVEEALGIIENI